MALKRENTTRAARTRIKSNQHVVPKNNHWVVCGTGAASPTSIHRTQAEAIEAATEIARNSRSEVVIHSRDGRIRQRLSYSPADDLMLRVWESLHEKNPRTKQG